MKIKTLTEFHDEAPVNATHVLRLGDKFEYANFTGFHYDSCDNATMDEMLSNSCAANSDWVFNVGSDGWEVHLNLNEFRSCLYD